MAVGILLMVLLVAAFAFFQAIVMAVMHTTPYEEAKKKADQVKNSKGFRNFVARKQLGLKKSGADIFLSDGITVSQWYLYKAIIAAVCALIALMIAKLAGSGVSGMIAAAVGIIGWFFLDLYLRFSNKSSNDEMMADICEMSRSVLYGKRGGQYIADALKDAVLVVENKRLKTALIKLRNDLDSNMSMDEALEEFERNFSNGEISAFCTVIKSLQSTGQVDEALNTLENNIEREQVGVNKRRCVILENKTMMYVMMIAFDILAVILYCIIMKLLDMQIAF